MDSYVVLILHHFGHFVGYNYVGGEKNMWNFLDVDKIFMSIFGELIKEHNELK